MSNKGQFGGIATYLSPSLFLHLFSMIGNFLKVKHYTRYLKINNTSLFQNVLNFFIKYISKVLYVFDNKFSWNAMFYILYDFFHTFEKKKNINKFKDEQKWILNQINVQII